MSALLLPAAPSSRRDFFKSAAGGLATVGLFGGSALVLTSQKARAQSGSIDPNVLDRLIGAAQAVYGSGWTDPNALQFLSSCIANFQSNLDALGLNAQLGPTMGNNAGAMMPFDANFQGFAWQALQALGWSSGFDEYYCQPIPDAQPLPEQVGVIVDAPTFDTLHFNQISWTALAASIMGYQSGLGGQAVRKPGTQGMRTQGQQRTVTKSQAEIATTGGGVMAAGGGILMQASGVTAATLGEASGLALGFFTGGAALVVIGLGIAGYYGWQYLQSQQSTAPVATNAVNMAIEAWDE